MYIKLKLICETDFRVWSCSFYVWTDLELVILLCIVSSPSNRSEVYKVRSQKICCEISCIDCHLSKFKGHRSDCIITIFPDNFTRFFVFYSFCFIVNCPFCTKRNTPIHCGRWVGGGPQAFLAGYVCLVPFLVALLPSCSRPLSNVIRFGFLVQFYPIFM